MKKKGLIVATIVMVLVLAVSLTTATYAWFSASSSTTIDGFNVEVVAGNVMNIGVSPTNTYIAAASADSFVSGSVEWTNPAAGVIGFAAGGWTGDQGLSATLAHSIQFGEVTKAVGKTTNATITSASTADTTNLDGWDGTTGKLIAAQKGATDNKLASQTLATSNLQADGTHSDFAYLFLGAQPTAEIASTSNLCLLIESNGTGTTLGMAAAIHVAYRLNGATTFTDVDVFATNRYTAKKTDVSATLTAAQQTSSGKGASVTGAALVTIPLTADGTDASVLDQIELIIYLSGSDSDCIDAAKGAAGRITIFFDAALKVEG